MQGSIEDERRACIREVRALVAILKKSGLSARGRLTVATLLLRECILQACKDTALKYSNGADLARELLLQAEPVPGEPSMFEGNN